MTASRSIGWRGRTARRREDDPIPPVARALAEEAWVLCFDEFSVTDIADAMVLSRLFSALFANGVVLVATSNVAPDDLYRDGLNRQLFLPFIGLLKRHARGDRARFRHRLPDGEAQSHAGLPDAAVARDRPADGRGLGAVTRGKPVSPETVAVKGRQVPVPLAAGDAARFSFAELCDAPLGARDYLAIAARYSTIFVDRIPVLDQTRRNPAKRFILLIDTLYDSHSRLFASAEVSPQELYQGRPGVTEAFEFDRTVSRLIEMQSREWLDGWAERQGNRPAAAS